MWPLDSIVSITCYNLDTGSTRGPRRPAYIAFATTNGSKESASVPYSVFDDLCDRLVQAVGLRLMTEYCQGLKQDKIYRFGDAYLTDAGALLPRTNILGRQTLVFCQWSDIRYSETYYDLILRTSNSWLTRAVLDYKKVENGILLAHTLALLAEHKVTKLSELLDLPAGAEATGNLHDISAPFGLRQLPGELDPVEHAYVKDAIAASQSGRPVLTQVFSIVHMLKTLATIIIATLVALIPIIVFSNYVGIDMIGFLNDMISSLTGTKVGANK